MCFVNSKDLNEKYKFRLYNGGNHYISIYKHVLCDISTNCVFHQAHALMNPTIE